MKRSSTVLGFDAGAISNLLLPVIQLRFDCTRANEAMEPSGGASAGREEQRVSAIRRELTTITNAVGSSVK